MALNDGRAISNFIVQALQNKPITMHGDGTQTRSFCYVEDTASGLIELMNSDLQGPVNIGNPDEIKLIELAEQIIDLTNSTSEIIYQDSAVDDPQRRCPDISQAIGKLAWSPTIDRRQGLMHTIEYIKEQLCKQ